VSTDDGKEGAPGGRGQRAGVLSAFSGQLLPAANLANIAINYKSGMMGLECLELDCNVYLYGYLLMQALHAQN